MSPLRDLFMHCLICLWQVSLRHTYSIQSQISIFLVGFQVCLLFLTEDYMDWWSKSVVYVSRRWRMSVWVSMGVLRRSDLLKAGHSHHDFVQRLQIY